MSVKEITIDEECQHCGGTGVYVGMGERNGAGVVCHYCKGTGCYHFEHEYTEFTKRHKRDDIKRVYQTNPGILIGEGNGFTLEMFGGMPYSYWLNGKKFEPGMENRNYTCPAWWYQSADYSKKPKWDKCNTLRFSQCKYFGNKSTCWEDWDKEQTC